MNRRGFLGLLAGAALDPERLVWRPGKLISIPRPGIITGAEVREWQVLGERAQAAVLYVQHLASLEWKRVFDEAVRTGNVKCWIES